MAEPSLPPFGHDPAPLAAPGRTLVPFERVTAHEPAPHGLVVVVEDADGGTHRVRLTAWAAGVLRVQFRRDDALPVHAPSPVLLDATPAAVDTRVHADGSTLRLEAPGLQAVVARAPYRLAVGDGGGVRLAGQVLDRAIVGWVSPPTGVWRDRDGTDGVHETFELAPDEALAGLGESYHGLDLRGRRRTLWATDPIGLNTTDLAYKPVPFWLSSRGYGCLLHRPERAVVDCGAHSAVALGVAVAAPEMDYFVFLGDPRTALRRYTALTGRPPVPPRWVFGVWMSRCMYRTRAEVEAVVEGMQARDLPLDVVHLDPLWLRDRSRWMLDACHFEWDEEAFPDPAGFVAWLRERGVRLSLWENPYAPRQGRLYEEGRARGFFARRPDGEPAAPTVNPDAAVVDFTNPEAAAWWADQHRPLLALGVACFKTDYGESVPADARFASGESGASVHNRYPLLYNRTVFEVTHEATGTGVVFARAATAGSQRHPVHWSGDVQSTWGGMAGALRGGLGFACSGGAFWGHDIGGFWGPDGFAPPSARLYIRWAQFGLLSPIARFHGTTPREPWEFGDEAVAIVRAFSRLRARLVPYLEACAREAAATGVPVLRPLLFDHPGDPLAWRVDLQYLLGPLLLVAPMFDEGDTRDVYLPAGEWWDWWEDRVHHGPGFVRVPSPLTRIPMFVRGGSVLPLAPAVPHAGAAAWDPVLLEVRAGANEEIRMSDGHDALRMRVVAHGSHLVLEIAPTPRTVTIRVCGGAAGRVAAVERGRATCFVDRDERGAVIAVRAPEGARVRLQCRPA
jgi:alpha-D-xyloside xylohydrolase